MNKKFRRFIKNLILITFKLSFAICICEALENLFSTEVLVPVIWGLYAILFVAVCLFAWRFYTGVYRDGDFLE